MFAPLLAVPPVPIPPLFGVDTGGVVPGAVGAEWLPAPVVGVGGVVPWSPRATAEIVMPLSRPVASVVRAVLETTDPWFALVVDVVAIVVAVDAVDELDSEVSELPGWLLLDGCWSCDAGNVIPT